ncbi:MAG: DUF3520 domain-containing protein [Bacteroidetes bacterium]|nr:DUF3520 domain-containing protein [Bacteroidota bacterium]
MKKLNLILTAIFFLSVQFIFAQYTFSGKVLDESGSPLIGASILIKGTTQGTITDFEGKFTLNARDSILTLIVSYTGYGNKELKKVKAGKKIKAKLNQSIALEEVVVTSYGVKKERRRHKMAMDMASPSLYNGAVRSYAEAEPPAYNTEDYDVINENRFLEALQNPLSTFSIDVDAASYSNMRRYIQNGQTPPRDAIRIEEMVNYFNYEYPDPTDEHPFTVVTEISDCPWQSDHRLLHVGLQGKHIPMDNLPASNLVFLIDVSGSMDQPNKLPLLQSSFKLLVDQLREKDKVAIVVYAGAAGQVLPSTNGTDKQKIKDALTKLRAGGSTAGGAGIKLAYKIARESFEEGGNNRVILATDGDFNIGQSSDSHLVQMIEKERESGIFLTVLGFGMGNYKDNKMQKLADSGNGNHAYIDNITEAKKVLVNEFGGTLFTIAKDVKFQIEFNPSKVQGYRLIGYENRMLNKEDFNDDKKDAGELGSGHTVTALYEIIPIGVKSSFLTDVDKLKYQKNKVVKSANQSDEMLTIKLRYKKPDGHKSQLFEKPILDNQIELKKTSNNFRWAASVAEFGMLLRVSEFKGDATYASAIKLAKNAKGDDNNGYRKEMINMLEVMQSLAEPELSGK